MITQKNDTMTKSDKTDEKDTVASAVDAIVMCSTEIRIKELEGKTEVDER